MRPLIRTLIAFMLTAGVLCAPANARLQPDLLCYEPDFEWPLPCDEDD